MNILNNLNIKSKFLLLFLIFTIPLLYFVSASVYEELKKQHNLVILKNQLVEYNEVTALIHQIQLERALSISFHQSRGKNYSGEMKKQRLAVDKLLTKVERKNVETISVRSLRMLDDLASVRHQISLLKVDSAFIINYYSGTVGGLISDISKVREDIGNSEIKSQVRSLLSLSNLKESLGLIRAVLAGAIASENFTRDDYGTFRVSKGRFDLYLNQFSAEASPEMLQEFESKFSGDAVKTTLSIIEDVKESTTVDTGIEKWLSVSTASINRLRNAEIACHDIVINNVSNLINGVRFRVVIFVTFLIAVFSIAVVLASYIIKLITTAIYQIKNASERVTRGETDLRLEIKSEDELGKLAKSFNLLAERNYQLSVVAQAIGKGDYTQHLEVVGDKDVLGSSLLKMRNNLKDLSERDFKRNFILTGNDQLNDIIRSERRLDRLANNVIHHLCSHLKMELGAFYIIEEDNRLNLLGTYGLKQRKNILIEPGDGLVGQAAVSQEPILITDIPKDYWKIETAFLDEKPRSLYIIPIIYDNATQAVIELASIKEPDKLQKEFLESVSEKIAIIINAIKADQKTTDLLIETQNQAQEMEAQQEELRQINDELKEQSLRLQASEEELRSSQEELQEKNAELEEKANELEEQYEAIQVKNNQLEQARNAIQEKMEQLEITGKYRSEFLANMSHELRTPLNSVLILAKLLSENKQANLTDKQVEFATVIHKSGSDLLTLINDILDLSKIEAGKIGLKIESFKLDQLDVQSLFEEQARQNNIHFKVQYDRNVPEHIVTDKFRLEQALKNLLSNAFKFTPSNGEITLFVHKAPSNLSFKSDTLKNQSVIAFSVKDTGIGIPPEKHHLIFEAFQQADASTSRKYGGTGLGLAITRQIVNLLGGEIRLESEPGKGSTFTIFIPEKYKEQEQPKLENPIAEKTHSNFKINPSVVLPHERPVRLTTGKKTVLIIEDDKNYGEILGQLAEEKKLNPIVTNSGEEGLRFAREKAPDAILLDLFLPDLNGKEILKLLKEDPNLRNIPVHIISAADEEEAGEKLGAASFIKKPASAESLNSIFQVITGDKKISKILIIEDNEDQNNSLKELLASRGLSSEPAFSGNQALQLLKEKSYDCIILDLNLPDLQGLELLEKIKTGAEQNNIPIVIYSGRDLSRDEEEKLKKYTNAIIVKTANSYDRLLDEVNLFLHDIRQTSPKKSDATHKLYKPEEVLKDKKVLLVDDDIRNIYALYSVFEDHQLKIVTASNGVEALKKLEENPDINLVLMDIMMPEMDGYEAMRQIRKNEKLKHLPVIALTAKAMRGDRERCIEAGASDYISKPIDTDKLLSLMRVWLYQKSN